MANGIENAGVTPPKTIKVRGKEMSVTPNQKSIPPADLLAGAGKFALSFLPGSGEAIAAEDYFKEVDKFMDAKKKGDVKGMTGAGIMGFLAGAGTLPIIGYGPRIIKNVYKGGVNLYKKGSDLYDAFRASRADKGIETLSNPETNEVEELVTSMLPVIQESRTVTTLKEKPTAVPIGDADLPTGFMSADVPFYSKGLEVVDNINYKKYMETGKVERIRPTLKTKDESLTAAEWDALFKKYKVPKQELDETGVTSLLDTSRAAGERVDVNTVRQLFLQNPIRDVEIAEYGGKGFSGYLNPVNDLGLTLSRTSDRLDADLGAGGTQYSQLDLDLVDELNSRIANIKRDFKQGMNRMPTQRADGLEIINRAKNKIGVIEEQFSVFFEKFPEVKEKFDILKQQVTGGELDPTVLAERLIFPRPPKFQDSAYTLQGGDDYGEFVFKAKTPLNQEAKVFDQHFPGEENPIAHVRFDSRKIVNRGDDAIDMNEGDEVLFIQELQSDIHQKARELDMMGNPKIGEILNEKVMAKFIESNKDLDKTIRELASAGYDITPAELKQLEKLIAQESKNIEMVNKATPNLGAQGDKMPFAPLQGEEAWADYVIKFMANKAHQGGKKWLAIAPADMVSMRDSDFISEGNARFYGTSDLRTIEAAPRYNPEFPGQRRSYIPEAENYKEIKKGEMILPKILERLSKIDPNRSPAKITTITINGPGGEPTKVLAMEIDERFAQPFTLYKRAGGIVTLPIKW